MCAGCGGTIAVRNVLRGLHEGDKAVIGNATGCLEVSTFTYPYTSWEDSYIHNAFENAGATLSGVEGAYKALKRKGRLINSLPSEGTEEPMISDSSRCPELWSVTMIWFTSAMITELT